MQDVPASYLHYLWTTGLKDQPDSPVYGYIKDNLSELQMDHPDGIWN